MDFVVRLPKTPSGKNSIWVIIDDFNKSTHFLLVTNIEIMDKLIWLYVKEIVRLYGKPKTIVLD